MNTNFLREKSPFVQASFLSLGEKVNFSNRYLDITVKPMRDTHYVVDFLRVGILVSLS